MNFFHVCLLVCLFVFISFKGLFLRCTDTSNQLLFTNLSIVQYEIDWLFLHKLDGEAEEIQFSHYSENFL